MRKEFLPPRRAYFLAFFAVFLGDFFAAFLAAFAMIRGSCDNLTGHQSKIERLIRGTRKPGRRLVPTLSTVILDRPINSYVASTTASISTLEFSVKRKFLFRKRFAVFSLS